jgi:ankyrin repeat protein
MVNYLQYIFAGNQDQSLLNESEKNLLSIPLVNSTFSDVELKLKIYQQIYYNRPDEYIEKLYDDVCKYAECFKKYLSNSVNEIVSIKDCIMAYYNIIFVYLSDILDSAQGTQFKDGFDIKQATSLFGSIKYFNDIILNNILNNPKQIFAEKLDDNYKKQIKLMFDRITEQLLKLVKLSPKQKYVFKDIKPLLDAIDMQRLINENQIIFKQLVNSMQLKRKENNHKNSINCLTSNFSPNSSLNDQIKKQSLTYKDQGEFLLFLLHKGMVIPINKKILKIKNPIITQKYLISARRVFLLINKFCQQKQNIDFFKGCRFILKRQFNSYDDDKIKQLFSKLINVRVGKKLGHTCLHKAVIANNFYLVKFLLEYNPDLSIRDNNNKTAFDLAKKDGNVEIINVFKSKMGIKQSNERANVMGKRNG